MVCKDSEKVVMSTTFTRDVVSTCDRSISKMQAIAELLLLTTDLRPVTTDTLSVFRESYTSCRDTIIARIGGLKVLSRDIDLYFQMVPPRWPEIVSCITDMCELVVGFIECCSHAVYLFGISYPQCSPAQLGIVDRYKICRANIEIKLCCDRLHHASRTSPLGQLSNICSEMSKHLSELTECCQNASERISSSQSQDQFKLCFKSITSSASSLMTCIKTYGMLPTEENHHIVLAFAEAVMATCNAMVTFAAGDDYTGIRALFTTEVRDIQADILGACMSVVSSCNQLLKTIKELARDAGSESYLQKLAQCMEAIGTTSTRLSDALQHYEVNGR